MYHQRFKSLDEKFWEKTLVGDSADCWAWVGAVDEHGRGNFWNGAYVEAAPRVAYRLMRGGFGKELNVLHRCDNPNCVNPKHLFLGTQRDNVLDMMGKGRKPICGQPKGASHSMAKLGEGEIWAIRDLHAHGTKQSVLARHFGVSRSQISRIVRGQRWATGHK